MIYYVSHFWNRIRWAGRGITTSGCVRVDMDRTATLKVQGKFLLGIPILGRFCRRHSETILVLSEKSHLQVEDVTFGRGCRFKLAPGAVAHVGKDSYISENSSVSISSKLRIGRECQIAWDVQIIDDDGHRLDQNSPVKEISIGDHVWIGARAMILKGTHLGDGCVVAAGAVVSGTFPPKSLIGGVPAKIIRENVDWQ